MVVDGLRQGTGVESGYMEVHTVASTYVSVVKQGYSSCPCRASLMSFQGFVVCIGEGHRIAAAIEKRWEDR